VALQLDQRIRNDVQLRYSPRYTRSQVAFFEGGLFGYSNLEGTRVLEVPEAQ
jgi:hypothetical protein